MKFWIHFDYDFYLIYLVFTFLFSSFFYFIHSFSWKRQINITQINAQQKNLNKEKYWKFFVHNVHSIFWKYVVSFFEHLHMNIQHIAGHVKNFQHISGHMKNRSNHVCHILYEVWNISMYFTAKFIIPHLARNSILSPYHF